MYLTPTAGSKNWKIDNERAKANKILAKHDENYMPPEVAEALKKTGKWKGEGDKKWLLNWDIFY